MRLFLDEDFLLESDVAVDLYHRFAADLPIIDYHCHLSPQQMAADHRFRSITEIWLEGDHYKWRAMRTNGVPERFCTGDASDWEKFEAWARTVPDTLRSPLYHWVHMELRRPFGIDVLLSPATARAVYDRCNERLREDAFTALGLLRDFRVAVVCTTDDPTDSLEPHRQLAARPDPETRVYPTWRPDRAFAVEDPPAFNAWVEKLEHASGRAIGGRLTSFLDALAARHEAFHEMGCRASDHGLETIPAEPWSDTEVEASFDRLRAGRTLDTVTALALKSALVHRLALLDHARGWVQQFHLGALRNNNTRLRRTLGPDTGFDSIGDFEIARPLSRFLDRLDETNQLAKTILYNLNPRDNALLATMMGNFQDGSAPGKMQYGSAWWFLDQLDGMRAQMDTLSNMGLLARFVGMVTDSRSFLSYSRHEYFRRLLCNLLGEDVRRGLLPDDREALGRLVSNVSFFNARDYFGFLEKGSGGISPKSLPTPFLEVGLDRA
ncbi:MAG: glucuronate isomerase [Acidobacteria bacterium]|nr:glucuronate isomerase [Acidobacteriota bacterium]